MALAVNIIFKKNGKFPETHISDNKEMKKRQIYCVKVMDALERKKSKQTNYSHNCGACSETCANNPK